MASKSPAPENTLDDDCEPTERKVFFSPRITKSTDEELRRSIRLSEMSETIKKEYINAGKVEEKNSDMIFSLTQSAID